MKTSYLLLTLFFVACLATGGIFVKLSELPPINTGLYRVLVSLPLLYLFIRFDKKQQQAICTQDKFILFISGLFLGGDLILWNISFSYTTVANANLLVNLVPFTIIPVSYFVYKEKISRPFFVGLILSILGVFILITGKASAEGGHLYGDFFAFLASVFYAAFLLIVYKVRNRISCINVMYYSGYGTITALLIASLIIEGIHYPKNLNELLPILGLAIFSQLLGQGGLSYILGKITAVAASILVLTQPVISALYAYLLFQEKLTTQEMIGIFIVILGIFFAKRN